MTVRDSLKWLPVRALLTQHFLPGFYGSLGWDHVPMALLSCWAWGFTEWSHSLKSRWKWCPHGFAEYSPCLVLCRGSNFEAFDRSILACLVTPSFETILPSPSSSQSSSHWLCDGGSSLEQPSVLLWDHSSVALNNSWLLLKWLIHANLIKELPVHILHVLIFPIIDKLRIFQIFNSCLNICLMIPYLSLFSLLTS